MKQVGLIKPRIAVIQAAGANPFYESYKNNFSALNPVKAETIATANRIGNPVNFTKAKSVIEYTDGVVEEVSEKEIIAAKVTVDSSGIGCEPASACSVAGLKKLKVKGIVKDSESVVCILTGNILERPRACYETSSGSIQKTIVTIRPLRVFFSNFI